MDFGRVRMFCDRVPRVSYSQHPFVFMVDEGPLYSGVKPKTLTHEHAVRREDPCISILRIS